MALPANIPLTALRFLALANETSIFSLEKARSAEPQPSGDSLRSVNGEPGARPSECLAVLSNPALPPFAPLGSDEEATSKSPASSVKAMMLRKKRRVLKTTSAPAFRPIRGMLASGRLPTAILSKVPTQNRGKTRTTTRPIAAPSSACQHHKWAERANLVETPTATSVTTVSSVITLLTGAPSSVPVNETSRFRQKRGQMWILGWMGKSSRRRQRPRLSSSYWNLITATRSTQVTSRSS